MHRPHELLGIADDLDEIILDFAFLANHFREVHPANAGDVSQVLGGASADAVLRASHRHASEWFSIGRLEELSRIRADGRVGYRSQGVQNEEFLLALRGLAGRVLLITTTGSQIPAISHTITLKRSGQLLNLVEVDETARRIRILYGNREYGTIPSIETHVHLLANAISISEGLQTPATVHAHPYHLVLLGRKRIVAGRPDVLNVLLYTQVEGLLRNYTGLVGVVPYYESGSTALALGSLDVLKAHRMVLWMNHGFVVRSENIRRAYILLSYAEEAARAALDALTGDVVGLPLSAIEGFLSEKNLIDAHRFIRRYVEGLPDLLQVPLFSSATE